MAHFQSLQQMIEQLIPFGYRDVTEEVKPYYHGEYFHLCTLDRPASEQEKGPIYCDTVEDLVTLLEQVNPSLLEKQVWFCESCQAVSAVRYRKGDGYTDVTEALGRDHRTISPGCTNATAFLRVINPAVIASRDALDADSTIPGWAKERLAELLLEPKESPNESRNTKPNFI
jgi:hypothetical protein